MQGPQGTEVLLGRRSLIEYVMTTGHRGNARTSITYRICKDHRVTEVMLGRRSLIEYVRTTGHRGNARTSITYRICKDHRAQR